MDVCVEICTTGIQASYPASKAVAIVARGLGFPVGENGRPQSRVSVVVCAQLTGQQKFDGKPVGFKMECHQVGDVLVGPDGAQIHGSLTKPHGHDVCKQTDSRCKGCFNYVK